MCLKGSSEICVRPAEPDLDLGRAPTREHYSHQHHGVAGTGVDRFFFTWYLKIYVISTLALTMPSALLLTLKSHGRKSNLCLLCYFAVCSWVTPRTSPAHRVHLLCCWCSSCFQHYCNTDPEIVSLWIQNLNFSTVYGGWLPENSVLCTWFLESSWVQFYFWSHPLTQAFELC